MRLERGSDSPLGWIYYYNPTPRFSVFLAVSRWSSRAVLNELLTSSLGRLSTPTRPQVPDQPQTDERRLLLVQRRRLILGRNE